MTKLLEQALSALSQLPENEQDAIASLILEEIASEERWNQAFANSQTQLAQLANEALAEFQQGKTQPLNFSELYVISILPYLPRKNLS